MIRLGLFILLLTATEMAWADRGSALQFVGSVLMFVPGAQPFAYALLLAGGFVKTTDARRQQRRAAAKQRQDYNDKLEARTFTALTADPPHRVGYGRSTAGGDVLAVFTTDKSGVTEFGVGFTKADGLRHLVIHYSSREIEAIHDVIIDGVRVGELDAEGHPVGGEFATVRTESKQVEFVGSVTLPEPATAVLAAYKVEGSGIDISYTPVVVTVSSDGLTLSCATPGTITVDYTIGRPLRAVRISKFLGGADQPVDPYLHGLIPDKWTVNHRLRGLAGIVITLDLEDQRFQGGLPNILIDASWSKVYDPRLDSTQPGGSGPQRADQPSTWTHNNTAALCVRDHLCGEAGLRCDGTIDIDDSYTVAAANACDVLRTFDDGAGPYTGKTYTINGVFTSEQGAEAVLEDLTEAMAGTAVPAGQWQIIAGAWTPPVRTLTDDDLAGSIELLQADTGMGELLNTARARYIAQGETQGRDAKPPYTNPALVAADQGEELAQDFTFPYTASNARVRQLCRIKVERSRNGLMIRYPGKMRLWGLRVGERVLVNSATFGWAGKTFRVTDRAFSVNAPVDLVLQEDAPGIWDDVDAGAEDATPNTGLPNPNVVAPIAGLAASSSSTTALVTADGTVTPLIVVSWDAITVPYMIPGGQVLLRWRRASETAWRDLPPVLADTREARITGAAEGEPVLVEATLRNSLGRRSDARFVSVRAVGKGTPPANVAGFGGAASKGQITWAWTPSGEADYSRTEVRASDANWGLASPAPLFAGAASSWAEPVASTGARTRYARHIDASGNVSAASVSASVTVNAVDLLLDSASPRLVPASFSLPAYSDGVVTSYTGCSTTMSVQVGATDDSSAWSYSHTVSEAGITTTSSGSPAGRTVTVTAVPAAMDSGWVEITATKAGYPNQVLRFALSKSKGTTPSAGPNPLLGNLFATGSRTATSGTSVTVLAGIEFRSDGTVYSTRTSGGSTLSTKVGDWRLPNGTGVGAGFSVRFDPLGNPLTGYSSTANRTAAALSSAQSVLLSVTGTGAWDQTQGASYAVTRDSDGAQVMSGTLSLQSLREV